MLIEPVQILLVEDDENVAELVSLALAHTPTPASLVHAPSLSRALARLGEGPVDVVLVDLNLPDSSGAATIQRVRAAAPLTPIIALTSAGEATIAERCIEAGADDFVDKRQSGMIGLRRMLLYALDKRQRAEISELRTMLDRERSLSSLDGRGSRVTSALAGADPVRQRAPAEFDAMVGEYQEILDMYLEHLVVMKAKPEAVMEETITRLGDLGGGPRDLIDVHLRALERGLSGSAGARAMAYAYDARLFALEMMGLLAEYYRVGVRRRKRGV